MNDESTYSKPDEQSMLHKKTHVALWNELIDFISMCMICFELYAVCMLIYTYLLMGYLT